MKTIYLKISNQDELLSYDLNEFYYLSEEHMLTQESAGLESVFLIHSVDHGFEEFFMNLLKSRVITSLASIEYIKVIDADDEEVIKIHHDDMINMAFTKADFLDSQFSIRFILPEAEREEIKQQFDEQIHNMEANG